MSPGFLKNEPEEQGMGPFPRKHSLFEPAADLFLRLTNRTTLKRPYSISSRAVALHQALFVVDLHCDALLANRDLFMKSRLGHVDIPRLLEGNMAIQVFSIPTVAPVRAGIPWIPTEMDAMGMLFSALGWPSHTRKSTLERALHACRRFNYVAKESQGVFRSIMSVAALDAYVQERQNNPGLTAGILGVEGLHCLESSINNLDIFFDAGVRTAGLVHLSDNDLGGSAHGRKQGGITSFGESVLAGMEKKSMLVDLAHASARLLDDVLDRATRPMIISHTGLKGAHNNDRNISDGHARRIAAAGGIIGIGFFPWAIGACTMKALLKTLLYAVNLVGADSVALGSDFDGMVATPFDVSGMALLTDALLEHGLTTPDIAKIMGGNALRVFRDTLPPV
jgi:membrane dipeptidase